MAFCTFAWVSQCASTVSVPHLIPRTVFPLTPSRPPRTVLNGVHHTISLDTEYCFWLYLGFNECYGACFEIVILLSAYCSSFPLPFHLPGLELASFVWNFVSTLDWLSLFFCVVLFWSLLRFTFVLLSGIRLVVACSVFVVFVACSVCIFSVWHLPNPHLFSLLDSSSWVGVPVPTTGMILQWAYLHSLLLCFSFSRLLWAFPIPLSWTIQFPLRMCPQ